MTLLGCRLLFSSSMEVSVGSWMKGRKLVYLKNKKFGVKIHLQRRDALRKTSFYGTNSLRWPDNVRDPSTN